MHASGEQLLGHCQPHSKPVHSPDPSSSIRCSQLSQVILPVSGPFRGPRSFLKGAPRTVLHGSPELPQCPSSPWTPIYVRLNQEVFLHALPSSSWKVQLTTHQPAQVECSLHKKKTDSICLRTAKRHRTTLAPVPPMPAKWDRSLGVHPRRPGRDPGFLLIRQLVTCLPATTPLVETTWSSSCPPTPLHRLGSKIHSHLGVTGTPLLRAGMSEETSLTEGSDETPTLRVSCETVPVSTESRSSHQEPGRPQMHEKRPSVNADKDNRDVRLSGEDCKEVVIKVVQCVITNILETNEKKKENLNKR